MEGNCGLQPPIEREANEGNCSTSDNSNSDVERYSAIKKKVNFRRMKLSLP